MTAIKAGTAVKVPEHYVEQSLMCYFSRFKVIFIIICPIFILSVISDRLYTILTFSYNEAK